MLSAEAGWLSSPAAFAYFGAAHPRTCARSLCGRRPERRTGLHSVRCVAEKDKEVNPQRKRARRRNLSDGSILFVFGEIDEPTESRKSEEEVLKELKNVQKTTDLNNNLSLEKLGGIETVEAEKNVAEDKNGFAVATQQRDEKGVSFTEQNQSANRERTSEPTDTESGGGNTKTDLQHEKTEAHNTREIKIEMERPDGHSTVTNHQSVPRWTHQELSHLRVEDLRQLCRESGIRRYSQLRKAELIETMLKSQ